MTKRALLIILLLISISILFLIGLNFKNKFTIEKIIDIGCKFPPCFEENKGILVSSPKINEKIKSPLKIEGKAKGFWFFEAEFIAELYDDNKNLLGRAILRAKDDWMTENFVPFEGELIFSQPSTNSGVLRFLNSNPSGLPEHQKIFEIPVKF